MLDKVPLFAGFHVEKVGSMMASWRTAQMG